MIFEVDFKCLRETFSYFTGGSNEGWGGSVGYTGDAGHHDG